jgi:hypothetical protein
MLDSSKIVENSADFEEEEVLIKPYFERKKYQVMGTRSTTFLKFSKKQKLLYLSEEYRELSIGS